MARWSTKATISLKRVKTEEMLLWRAYRNSPTLFRTVPSPTPYGLCFPKFGGSQPPPKTSIAIISGTGEATDFKCGRYIHRVHPKKPIKSFGDNGTWMYPGTVQIFGVPQLSQERVKLRITKFKFGRNIHMVHARNSYELQILYTIFMALIGRKVH